MIIILITAFCLSTPISDLLLKYTSSTAEEVHKKCLQLLPTHSKNRESLAALTCGEKISEHNLLQNLSKTSLIHIFIVSGSHLILIDQLLSILKIPFLLRFLFLSFYSLAVGWQPPAVRALLGLLLPQALQRTGLFLPTDLKVLMTGFLTLILFPSWWQSLSLIMSWCAALALCVPSTLGIRGSMKQAFAAQVSIMLFMSAPLWGLGSLHPLSLAYNLFLGPAVAFVLLPLALLCIPLEASIPLFDFGMSLFKNLLPQISSPVVKGTATMPSLGQLWLWVFLWHIGLHFLRLHLRQGKDSQ